VLAAETFTEAMSQRIEGLQHALQAFKPGAEARITVMETSEQFEAAYTTTIEALSRHPRPTAIFALTDVMAVGVMHAAAQLNLRLPRDLSVMGYDNILLAAYSIPGLTTIEQPVYRMGKVAADMLLARLKDRTLPIETVMLETRLIVRGSTASPPPA
jgi:LacI family transcriptional regulator